MQPGRALHHRHHAAGRFRLSRRMSENRDRPRFLLLALALLCTAPALAKGPGGGKSGAPFGAVASTTSTSTTSGRGGGSRQTRIDPRRIPPLDPERKVTEQDCTKPVDLTAGNLRCK